MRGQDGAPAVPGSVRRRSGLLPPRFAAAALMVVIAGVHFQQYVDFMSEVPTIGVLFLLNAAGGVGLAVALLGREPLLRALAALGAIGLALGSLVSIFLALDGSIFGYSEPSLRLPILIAIVAELLALPVLASVGIKSVQETLRGADGWPARRGR